MSRGRDNAQVSFTVTRVENGYTIHTGGEPFKGTPPVVHVAETEYALDKIIDTILEEEVK
jgi:hypothetical protein